MASKSKQRKKKAPNNGPSHYLKISFKADGQHYYSAGCPSLEVAQFLKTILYRLQHYKAKEDTFTYHILSAQEIEDQKAEAAKLAEAAKIEHKKLEQELAKEGKVIASEGPKAKPMANDKLLSKDLLKPSDMVDEALKRLRPEMEKIFAGMGAR